MVHPGWELAGGRAVGWVTTRLSPVKVAHLAANPHVGCAYTGAAHDVAYFDCVATWAEADARDHAWELFRSLPAPAGYDPATIWPDGPDSPGAGVLRLEPYRVQVGLAADLAARRHGSGARPDGRFCSASRPPGPAPRHLSRRSLGRVLFQARFWPLIVDGSVTVTFRRWKRRQVVAGHRYRTGHRIVGRQMIEVDHVDVVDPARITKADARRAGFPDADAVRAQLRGDPDLPVYRIRFHRVDDPTPAVSSPPRTTCPPPTGPRSTGAWTVSTAPARSARGPRVLAVIAAQPGTRARRPRRRLRAGDAAVQDRRAQAQEPGPHREPGGGLPPLPTGQAYLPARRLVASTHGHRVRRPRAAAGLLRHQQAGTGHVPARTRAAGPVVHAHLGRRPPRRAAAPVRGPAARRASQTPRRGSRSTTSGMEYWAYDGQRHYKVGLNAVVGRPREELSFEPTRFDEMRRGAWDIDARVHDMDLNGVYASLNFPSSLAGFAGQRYQLGVSRSRAGARRRARAPTTGTSTNGRARYPGRIIPCQVPWLLDPERGRGRDPAPTRRAASGP